MLTPHSLQTKDEGSMVLRNVFILLHYCKAWQSRRPRTETKWDIPLMIQYIIVLKTSPNPGLRSFCNDFDS